MRLWVWLGLSAALLWGMEGSVQAREAAAYPYPPLEDTPAPGPVAWFVPPEEYAVYSQFLLDVVAGQGLGLKACGFVAAGSAVEDLGYPRADLGVCLPAFKREAGGYYSLTYGIQPSHYHEVVQAVLESGRLGAAGEAWQVQAEDAQQGLLLVNEALWRGEAVIVDFLATTDLDTGGTYAFEGTEKPKNPSPALAHYARVLGFGEGGETIVLAESMHPLAYGNADRVEIPVEAFAAAWVDPENRARYKPAQRERLRYWMLIISPPEGYLPAAR